MATSQVHSHEFKIPSSSVHGPLNLWKTVVSAQTSEPEWERAGAFFVDVEELNNIPVKYWLRQDGTVDNFSITVQYLPSISNARIEQALYLHVQHVLGLEDDITKFYRTYSSKDDPLAPTFPALRGLRLMRGTNLYESLICSILSQNNSALRWNQIARLLMKHYGRRVHFPDGSTYSLFPRPSKLAQLNEKEMQSRTSIGYRARSVIMASKMIANEELHLEILRDQDYAKAMDTLLQLQGVGPKVADCFLLYGVGKLVAAPVDVWIHRIVTNLYFRGKKMSRPNTATFLRNRFGIWAGYAQLYLFDYARRSTHNVPNTRKLRSARAS